MNDPQLIIDSIRGAIETPESVSPDRQASLASEYVAACKEVNHRLEQCSRYLRTGNPCEAIRLAETTPHLLDLCNILDFPDREDWNAICKSLNLEVAPALNQTIIESLNGAYNVVCQSEELLKEHRRLALAHAPLKDRLAVLYKLGDIEPENVLWSDMIGRYETARIEEISNVYASAREDRNLGRTVPELLRELESTNWRNPPPASLVETIRSVAREAAVKQNIQQFRALAENFHHATVDGDAARAHHWQEQWNARLKTSRMPLASIPDEVRAVYNAASRWLAQLEQKNKINAALKSKVDSVERALESENDPEELDKLYRELDDFSQRFNVEPPPELMVALREKYNRLKFDKLRLRLLVGLAIVISGILIVLLVVQGIRVVLGSSRVNATAARVSMLLKNYHDCDPGKPDSLDSLEKAERELQRLKTDMPKSSKYQAVIKLDKALQEAQQANIPRGEQFLETIFRAEEHMLPDSQKDILLAESAVDAAKRLVRTTEENVRWQQTREKFVDLVARQKQREQQRLQQEVSRFETRAMDLEDNDTLSEEEVRKELAAIRKDFHTLASAKHTVPFPPEAEKKMEDRLQYIESTLLERNRIQDEFVRIGNAIGMRSRYAAALEAFEDTYRDSPLVRDFPKVRAELHSEANVTAWNVFATRSQGIWLAFANFPGPSRRFADRFEENVSRFAFIPEVAELSTILFRMQPLLDSGGRHKICERLEKFFTNEKKTLYVNHREENGVHLYDYFQPKGSGLVPWRKSGDQSSSSTLNLADLTKLPHAPHQSAFSDSLVCLRPLISSEYYTVAQWYEMAARVLRDFDPKSNDGMDPYVKLVYLKAVLEMLITDPIIEQHFADWLARLNHAALDMGIDWTDSSSKPLVAQRKLAIDIFNSLDSLQNRLDAVGHDVKALVTPILTNYAWIGFLRKKDKWHCVTVDPVGTHSGQLFVYRHPDGDPPRFFPVGELNEGKAIVHISSDSLLQGQPVFLREAVLPRDHSMEEI